MYSVAPLPASVMAMLPGNVEAIKRQLAPRAFEQQAVPMSAASPLVTAMSTIGRCQCQSEPVGHAWRKATRPPRCPLSIRPVRDQGEPVFPTPVRCGACDAKRQQISFAGRRHSPRGQRPRLVPRVVTEPRQLEIDQAQHDLRGRDGMPRRIDQRAATVVIEVAASP